MMMMTDPGFQVSHPIKPSNAKVYHILLSKLVETPVISSQVLVDNVPNNSNSLFHVACRPVTNTLTVTSPPLLHDYIICTGRPVRRYPHKRNCAKYYDCAGDADIVPPKECPHSLYFSPSALLCTLPQDSGCLSSSSSAPSPTSNETTFATGVTPSPVTTPRPGTWLAELIRNHRAIEEDRLVMYYDSDVVNPNALQWPISFTRDLWRSEIAMYGNFGEENRLYILLRGTPQSEDVNATSYLDLSRGNINTIEVGSSDWSVENGTNIDLITKNVAYIIIQSAKGIRYPGPELKWVDIFVYDYYSRTERTSDRDRYEVKMKEESENDIATVPMFSQWYLPIYRMYGSGSVLNRFFINRERYFPRAEADNTSFARTMNRGEFVHFWSHVAGANLQELATSVFGWSSILNDQFEKARLEFSALQY
ncbi:unnamed protein product [Orchesella dallaii]|uniref:Chitin-binding type-2 domain-containing protein n=1 Tax=Orchesella dallaii TaxID=48710 RepID=A0ABP1RZF1_9HEXA